MTDDLRRLAEPPTRGPNSIWQARYVPRLGPLADELLFECKVCDDRYPKHTGGCEVRLMADRIAALERAVRAQQRAIYRLRMFIPAEFEHILHEPAEALASAGWTETGQETALAAVGN